MGPNWSPLIWLLAIVGVVVVVLLATGVLHAGAIDAGSWS